MRQLSLQSIAFRKAEAGFGQWLDVLGYASFTVYRMPGYIRELLYHLEKEGLQHPTQITPSAIKAYFNALSTRSSQRTEGALTTATLAKHLQGLQLFCKYLRQTYQLDLPYLNISLSERESKEIEVLSIATIQALFAATQIQTTQNNKEALASRDKALLIIFYSCGLRRNEGVHLDVSDLDFDQKTLKVRKGKNHRKRLVPFNQKSSHILQEYVFDHRPDLLKGKPQNALFISERGKRLTGQSMFLRIKLLQVKTGNSALMQQTIHLHTLRHSIATHLLHAGMPLENISRFLGHQSLESTQIYTHVPSEAEGYSPNTKPNVNL